MIKNILITGGAGYIGSHVNEILVKNKKQAYIVDNLSTGRSKLIPKKSKFYKCDITNYKLLNKIFALHKPQSVFHFAACASVPESQSNPLKYFKNNVLGTKVLLDIISKFKIKNFVFSSTCAIFNSKKKKSE